MNAQLFDLVDQYGISQGANWALQVHVKSTAWLITIAGSPAGGAWLPGWGVAPPRRSVRLAYNATAAQVKAGFQALESIGATGVKSVTGATGGPWTLTLADDLIAASGNPAPTAEGSELLPFGGSISVQPAPFDLTGYTAKMQIRPGPGAAIYAELSNANGGIAIDGAAGAINLSIPGTTTALFPPWTIALYDLYVTSAGLVTTCAMFGMIEHRPRITALP